MNTTKRSHKRQDQTFGTAALRRPDSVSEHRWLGIDHMDAIITRGMNQQILDLEPKITRHLN